VGYSLNSRAVYPRSILVTSSPTRPTRAKSQKDATRMSGVWRSSVSGDFPVQLATRVHNWSAGGLLRCIVLPVCLCVSCRSPNSTSPTRTTCCGQVANILVRHVRYARFPRDMLATSSRGCHKDATRKLLPWNVSF